MKTLEKSGEQKKGDVLDIGGQDGVGYGRQIYVRVATGNVGWEWRPITVSEKETLIAALTLTNGDRQCD